MHNKDGKWMPRRTYGEAPIYRYGAGAVVHNDTMYLMCGTSSGPDKDYRVVRHMVYIIFHSNQISKMRCLLSTLLKTKLWLLCTYPEALGHLQVYKTMQ